MSLVGVTIKRCSIGDMVDRACRSYAVIVLSLLTGLRFRGEDGGVGGMALWCGNRCRYCFLKGREGRGGDGSGESRKLGHLSSNSGRAGRAGASTMRTITGGKGAVHNRHGDMSVILSRTDRTRADNVVTRERDADVSQTNK